MGYEDGRAGRTGKLCEAEAQRFLQDHGYLAVRPTGRDHGIDLIITSDAHPAACATA